MALAAKLPPVNRWGDYSAMTVDPVDDCTFWYTQEYYATNSSFNWRTRIGNFKFDSCGAGPSPSLRQQPPPLRPNCDTFGDADATATLQRLAAYSNTAASSHAAASSVRPALARVSSGTRDQSRVPVTVFFFKLHAAPTAHRR